MYNFDFYNPTYIIFGTNRYHELCNHIPQNSRILVTYGSGSLKKNGTINKIIKELHNNLVFEFGGIEANPKYEILINAIEFVKKNKIDFILAIGGGSVIDGSKFISLAAKYNGNPADILENNLTISLIKNSVPLGTILTLPAAGSEMNNGLVINYKGKKVVIKSEYAYPKFSILDPTLTYTLSYQQITNGIIDTFVHVMEQYLTYPVNGIIQDRLSEAILLTLIEISPKLLTDTINYDIKANHIWSSSLALNGLIAAGVPEDWSSHLIGHEITAEFGIDHAQTLAIIYPSLIEITMEQKKDKLCQYADRIWNIKEENENIKAQLAIEKTREFFRSLGVKIYLSDYGIDKTGIDKIIKRLNERDMINLSENGSITLDVVLKILNNAYMAKGN